ncbi:DEAD/DEAH box helicase [Nocardia sp. NPDC050408]|uniref:DEAD/DEAH box helicase n=1 Tax=Nocardia sp. NPDC050408 TaxID=3364319 RepID=UPI0037AD54F0
MGALLPTLQAERLREGLTDYLTTTFALTDPDTQGALTDFIGHPRDGLFKGPYVRLRLPFSPAGGNWGMHLDWWPKYFEPYGHQAAAFERLSTKFQRRPRPTLVTTGTGSGKTESFLIPILDHVLRAKKAGVVGMKALIIYPMNALANDQEQRLAKMITGHPELSGITAGLYTGEQSSGGRTLVSQAGLITDRRLMHDSPPDILLTNYKMLDHMLLRSDRAALWRQSADSLQYVVLDEFHTYDGAQGTDVAMLLRRLGLTIKAHWTSGSPVGEEDRRRPLGKVTPVATSATLGSKDSSPETMLAFAKTVFGETFDEDALIGETRLSVEDWLAARSLALDRTFSPIEPVTADAVEELNKVAAQSPTNKRLAASVLATLFRQTSDIDDTFERAAASLNRLDETEMLDLVKRHGTIARLLRNTVDVRSIEDLAVRALPAHTGERDLARGQAQRERYLGYLLAALSHLRAEVGRSALNVDVHLWLRELSRIDRAATVTPLFRWSDDGKLDDATTDYYPSLYCRHCGRSGWGVRLAPTGSTLDSSDDDIRGYHATGEPRFRALISAPTEAEIDNVVDGLQWFRVDDREIVDKRPEADSADLLDGRVLPVLYLSGPEADENSKKDLCPACGAEDGIRFLGSAIATQLSVALSNLFGDARLDDTEKKALIFTDSVQDAAHRAGFVQARSHTLSMRSTLRNALGDRVSGSQTLTLSELCAAVLERAGEDPNRRYRLLPPDIVEHDEFTAYWQPDRPAALRRKAAKNVARRVQFDIDLEFGLQSRLGRTLELTGSVVAEVDLGSPQRVAQLGAAALERTEHQLAFSAPDSEAVTQWVRGVAERMRTRGAVSHEWLTKYVQRDANRRWVWGGRPKGQGMPAFPKGRPAPAFPAVGGRTIPEGFDPITAATSWYARWAAQCLNVSPHEGGFLARALFEVLAEERIVTTASTEKSLTAYQLTHDSILVGIPDADGLAGMRYLLVCDVCQTPTPGSATVIDQLDGAPCLLTRCPGELTRATKQDNFYRSLYDSSEMKRVVAREHTSLLPTQTRLEYETKFKTTATDPAAPNVLVATPTLEMGIDIGDLSTVMLGSMPRTVSSYLQRVGRAGRLTGNALALAFVRGRGEHLPKLGDPTSVIQGEVRPPATFLTAEEILQRQYIAHIVDRLSRKAGAEDPGSANNVLSSFDEGTWMGTLVETADEDADLLLDEFLAQFGDTLGETAAANLRTWATPPGLGDHSGLGVLLREAVHRWKRDVNELRYRRTAVDAAIPEFEQRANSPAATDDDKRDLRTARGTLKLLSRSIIDLTAEHWVGVLERYGVLPNYTLLDDAVTLDVGITWIDPDTNEYAEDTASYRRGSRVALTELAPGATFYAQGLAVEIDAVDLGAGESAIHIWRVCPSCGWTGISHTADQSPPPIQCPRCHTSAIADVSQQLQVVEMTKVSAEVRRDESAITDIRDERRKESFTVLTAADINPDNITKRWFVAEQDFGAEYLRRMDIRWINMGRRNSQGSKRTIAGNTTTGGLFRVCSGCGQLDKIAGQNQPHEHRSWCKYRKADDEKHVREIALARTLRTQAVLLHLPSWLEYDSFAHPSLSAAILLGLRQVIGGSPEHLDVATITDALHAPNQRALLIHDTVPGGTGYLAEFANPAQVWAVLAAARELVKNCDCTDRLACHKCLLPFAPPRELDKVSRITAAKVLDDLLACRGGEPNADSWLASITEETPEKRLGSEESPLEREFYRAFTERLTTMGATIVEKPGTYGPTATIKLPGTKIRTWQLEPQVLMGNSQPDFQLRTADPDIPIIALFADGRRFHAVPGKNRVTDDARKREILRSGGVLVWSFSHDDLLRFTGAQPMQPSWYTDKLAKFTLNHGNLRPALFKLLHVDPITQLIEFMLNPDREDWNAVGHWLPLMFMLDGRMNGDGGAIAGWALDLIEGNGSQIAAGEYACWSYTDGPLTLTAALRKDKKVLDAVLALDDRDDTLELREGHAWKEWLRLANWFGLADHVVTTRSLLAADSTVPERGPDSTGAGLTPEWQALYDDTISDAERELVLGLAAVGAPVPELGVETDRGDVIDIGWADARIGVLLESPEAAPTMTEQGWTICPADPAELVQALKTNGVM